MATPSKLKPGDKVRRKGDAAAPVLVFIALDEFRRACRCQCDRYKGLDGPDDAGLVTVPAWDMAHRYERVGHQHPV